MCSHLSRSPMAWRWMRRPPWPPPANPCWTEPCVVARPMAVVADVQPAAVQRHEQVIPAIASAPLVMDSGRGEVMEVIAGQLAQKQVLVVHSRERRRTRDVLDPMEYGPSWWNGGHSCFHAALVEGPAGMLAGTAFPHTLPGPAFGHARPVISYVADSHQSKPQQRIPVDSYLSWDQTAPPCAPIPSGPSFI